MSIPINLESLTNSTFQIYETGDYNVEVEVDHTQVGITVAYGHELSSAEAQFFYHGARDNNNTPYIGQTFPQSVNLFGAPASKQSKIWIFTFLTFTQLHSGNGNVQIGAGAGATKDLTSGEAADVTISNYSGADGPLPDLGLFHDVLLSEGQQDGGQTNRWASLPLSNLLNGGVEGYQISIPANTGAGSIRSLLEQGVHILLLDTKFHMRGLLDKYNTEPLKISTRTHPDAGQWTLIALVSASGRSGKDFTFKVGDPEKESRIIVKGPT
ncbi:MAG: hypothetical protein AB8H12_17160 [Lewinella sp.]